MEPRKGGRPKISRFFFPFPPPFRCFCVSLGVFSWNFGGVLKRRCPEMCTFGVLLPVSLKDASGVHKSSRREGGLAPSTPSTLQPFTFPSHVASRGVLGEGGSLMGVSQGRSPGGLRKGGPPSVFSCPPTPFEAPLKPPLPPF